MQSTRAIQVKNSANYGGDGERLCVVVSEAKKKIEIRKQNLEGESGTRSSPMDLNVTVTVPVLEPGTLLHTTDNLRVTAERNLIRNDDTTPVTVTLNPVNTTPTLHADDPPMADDDQMDEDRYVAHVIMHWFECQNTTARQMTRRLHFVINGLKSLT